MTNEQFNEIYRRLVIGFRLTRLRVIEMKKQKGTEVVIMRDGKICRIKPEIWEKEAPPEN